MNRALILAVALALPAAAAAQALYKYERADGSIVYSDKPIPGARLLDRIQAAPGVDVVPAGVPRQGAAAKSAGDRHSALEAADAEVRASEQAVRMAQERLQAGMEPLPGERVGNVGDRSSRLRDEYFERLRALEQGVKEAMTRRELAYRKRNDLRD